MTGPSGFLVVKMYIKDRLKLVVIGRILAHFMRVCAVHGIVQRVDRMVNKGVDGREDFREADVDSSR